MKVFLLLLQVCLSAFTATHALIYKRDSRSAMSWITICIALPYVGAFLYYAFGINRVAYKAKRLRETAIKMNRISFKNPAYVQTDEVCIPDSLLCDPPNSNFSVASNRLAGNKWRDGNSFKILINGEQTYPEMLNEIDKAEESIYLMTYIFTTDKFGLMFIEALKKAQSRGVSVKVIVDAVASWYSIPSASRILTKAGIDTIKFTTSKIFPPSFGINLRNHKKLLLIDGHTVFTGGINIRGINFVEDPQNVKPKQDTHFKLTGPITHDCYQEFQAVWKFLTKEELIVPDFNPQSHGDVHCKLVTDGPDEALDKIDLILIDAVVSAKKTIKIVTPYFIPSRELISALNNAALRGVKVEIILPEKSDNRIVDYATRNMLWELLQRGVCVFYQKGPFDHSKLFIADSEYSIIGSANIDPRSLRLNYELILEIINSGAIRQLEDLFAHKLAKSSSVELKVIESRSLLIRIRDSICWLFSPYL